MVFRYDTRMNLLFESAPLAAFLIAYFLGGIYWATGVLMLVTVLVAGANRLLTGKFKKAHVVTAAVVVVLGSATLLLHDKRFIQWKPTALFAMFALVLTFSGLFAKKPLLQSIFETIAPDSFDLPAAQWRLLNWLWALWFAASAAANLYVAQNYSESVWVQFHTYGLWIANALFMVPQIFWIAAKNRNPPAEGS